MAARAAILNLILTKTNRLVAITKTNILCEFEVNQAKNISSDMSLVFGIFKRSNYVGIFYSFKAAIFYAILVSTRNNMLIVGAMNTTHTHYSTLNCNL